MQGQTQSISFDGREIRLTTGRFAPQAGGSVLVECGDTAVLVTATRSGGREGIDFLPLICDYEERLYAAGRIPGSYMRRESRPPERATLTARLIDRPMRPLFPSWLRDDLQVVATCLSLDERVPADVLAVTGASIATLLAGIPFNGPMAAVRVGLLGDDFVLNPSYREIERGDLDLVVAGTPDGVVMVEAGANQLPEQDVIEAIDFGYEAICELIKAQEQLLKDLGITQVKPEKPDEDSTVPAYLEKQCTKAISAVLSKFDQSKDERDTALETVKGEVSETIAGLKEDHAVRQALASSPKLLGNSFKALTKKLMRQQILKDGKRVDGRSLDEVRQISAMAGVLPRRVHGSGLFQRGLTQVLSTATLGTPSDAQEMDDLHPNTEKLYLHHYNFPPYSVGEAGRIGFTGRREVGHGRLARRGLAAVLPGEEEFPYTVRVVSEITESNGSSSMASVCVGSMALMAAGVPLKAPVAGIAMGLVKDGNQFAVLTDILGDEDHLGDMDFKVAGTAEGVTALQMDIKIEGINEQIMEIALEQALQARLHILGQMNQVIAEAREVTSENAPSMVTLKVDADKIRDIIGKGGATIRGITEASGATVDIDDDGTVRIFGQDQAARDAAVAMVEEITAEAEVGAIYEGRVARIVDFGAFVNILPGKDGLVHISQIANERVENVADYLTEGEEVRVKVLDVDQRGRIKLSIKELLDEEIEEEVTEAQAPVDEPTE